MKSPRSVPEVPAARLYREIVGTYRSLGFDEEVIRQWSLPAQDAQTLLRFVARTHPRRILEVGTFVGVTTLLLALATPPATRIHTVDPNLPLEIELGALKSRYREKEAGLKTQALARQAALQLGVADKITFHAGGFSTGNTFATYNTCPSRPVPVVGPQVCAAHGPFDFIFIDGLHYEEDVAADLALAATHLAPGGIMVLHDVFGPWGSNVRRAVGRFLRQHPEFCFAHGPYREHLNNIGALWRRKELDHEILGDPAGPSPGLVQEKIYPNLAAILGKLCSPARVILFGHHETLKEALLSCGVEEVDSLGPEAGDSLADLRRWREQAELQYLERRYDLCICMGIPDLLPEEAVDSLVELLCRLSDVILFASTPPGEIAASDKYFRNIEYWVKKFSMKGYFFHDVIRPVLEPLYYSDVLFTEYEGRSSNLLNLYIVKKGDFLQENSDMWEILAQKEQRIEDLLCQVMIQSNQIKKLIEEYNSVNLFNIKVLQNSLKRVLELLQQVFGPRDRKS